MKIIFLIEHDHGGVIPFKHRTYFDKVDVEYDYWDLRYLKNGKRAIEPIWVANSDLIIKKIHKSDLERELSTLKESVFITGHGISRKNRFFYCLLKKYNIPYIVLINVNYFFNVKINHWRRLWTIQTTLKSLVLHLIYTPIVNFFNKLAIDINRPALTILGNYYDQKKYNFPAPSNGVKYYYAGNYERIKNFQGKIQEDDLIIFIDQNLPWHNETVGYKWNMEPEIYYQKIARFLHKVQHLTGKKVIIAAHPKTEPGKIEPYFGSMPVKYGETMNLLAKCSLAITHMSTTIDYCIYFKKPLILLYCSEFDNSPVKYEIKLYGQELNKKILYLDQISPDDFSINELEKYSYVNDKDYSNYIYKNLHPRNAPEGSYWEYIANFVAGLALTNK